MLIKKLLNGAQTMGTETGYAIGKSLRLRSSALASLTRTPTTSSPVSQKYTLSFWFKHGVKFASGWMQLFTVDTAQAGTNTQSSVYFIDGKLEAAFVSNNQGVASSTYLFRDPAAWYHIVVSIDPTASLGSRTKIYVNGKNVTTSDTTTGTSYFNQSGRKLTIGRDTTGGYSRETDGYFSEFYMIEGQALSPYEFGESNAITGQWVPKAYVGTFGVNGFYLPFTDGANTTTLGYDVSGNNNHWLLNNFSVSGVTSDWLADSPTNNYCTLNPIDTYGGAWVLSNGNLTGASSSVNGVRRSTMMVSSGKWYWEVTIADSLNYHVVGVSDQTCFSWCPPIAGGSSTGGGYWYVGRSPQPWKVDYNNNLYNYGTTFTLNDVIGVALDLDNGTIEFFKNGVSQGVAFTGISGKTLSPTMSQSSGSVQTDHYNFGQRPFVYTPPTGFNSLCTNNLPEATIKNPKNHFDIRTYRGNGGALQVGNTVKESSAHIIDKSLRFNSADAAHLTWTPGVAGNRKTWTWSGWVKRSALDSEQCIFSAYSANTDAGYTELRFLPGDTLVLSSYATNWRITSQNFRDTLSHGHLIVAVDTTQLIESNRIKIYWNGAEITTFATVNNPVQNSDWAINDVTTHSIGRRQYLTTNYFNGYMSEINFIDGQALDPSYFGQSDANGVWIPKAYAGTYGANGFYLPFTDGTSTTTLGYDQSVNNNHWTLNNFSIVAGANNDLLSDTPTNTHITLVPSAYSSNGGLNFVNYGGRTTLGIPANFKCYFETVFTSTGTPTAGYDYPMVGITNDTVNDTITYTKDGRIIRNSTNLTTVTTFAANNVIGITVDADSIKWYKNNVLVYTYTLPANSHPWYPYITLGGTLSAGTAGYINFGQRPFVYAPPDGYMALNTDNLAIMGEVAGSPDLVMIKSRTSATDWAIYDSDRGATKDIASNLATIETIQPNGLQKFSRDGFYIGNLAKVNTAGVNYVAYMWDESPVAGMDIVSYTGDGASTRQIPHNLGVKPSFYIEKDLDGNTSNWGVLFDVFDGSYDFMYLNTTAAKGNATQPLPTNTYFTEQLSAGQNILNHRYIVYLFADVSGFSKIGKYTGNGLADGPFVYCGFKPAFVMVKRIDVADFWSIIDTSRNPYNASAITDGKVVYPNSAQAEGSNEQFDFLSNGFKVRNTIARWNANGGTFIYVAFAEAPYKYANAR